MFEGGLGVDAGGGSEGGDQSASRGVERLGNEGRASVISVDDGEDVLVGLETFSDADGDTVGVEGSTRSGSLVGGIEGHDGADVGVEGDGTRVVGRVVVASLLVLLAGHLIGILAKSGDAVARNEFASGVTSATVGIAEGRAGLVVADGLGGIDGVDEPGAETLGVALVDVVDSRAAGLDHAVTRGDVELALSAGFAETRTETVARVAGAERRKDGSVPEAAVRGNAFTSSRAGATSGDAVVTIVLTVGVSAAELSVGVPSASVGDASTSTEDGGTTNRVVGRRIG